MNELEMSATLGLIIEPNENRVKVDPLIRSEILYLKQVFNILDVQKKIYGPVNKDIWCELVPWHSLN